MSFEYIITSDHYDAIVSEKPKKSSTQLVCETCKFDFSGHHGAYRAKEKI